MRFFKQAITMFFSVNPAGFREDHPELARFVLDKSATGISPRYGVDLVLVDGSRARSSGITGMSALDGTPPVISSEIAYPPFALRLRIGESREPRWGAVEGFAKMGFKEERTVWVYTYAGHINTRLPGDYRSKDALARDRASSP